MSQTSALMKSCAYLTANTPILKSRTTDADVMRASEMCAKVASAASFAMGSKTCTVRDVAPMLATACVSCQRVCSRLDGDDHDDLANSMAHCRGSIVAACRHEMRNKPHRQSAFSLGADEMCYSNSAMSTAKRGAMMDACRDMVENGMVLKSTNMASMDSKQMALAEATMKLSSALQYACAHHMVGHDVVNQIASLTADVARQCADRGFCPAQAHAVAETCA